ncbi:MAG: multifunctional oxoglutarate decarboxylase/oxoglutarate dehydrogenase thiamine pyrophosphate-binding subunit/dihydrolipoyllysine-residue succinyltransferase subunit, partial [Ilumatobacteraceae bacterium]
MTVTDNASTDFGANSWLVDEMYEQYRDDPNSVSATWQEFFSDYKPNSSVAKGAPVVKSAAAASAPAASAAAQSAPVVSAPTQTGQTQTQTGQTQTGQTQTGQPQATVPASAGAPVVGDSGDPIRGAGAVIAANMQQSLKVPTATSFRNVPAKLLEVNRKVINGYRSRTGQG